MRSCERVVHVVRRALVPVPVGDVGEGGSRRRHRRGLLGRGVGVGGACVGGLTRGGVVDVGRLGRELHVHLPREIVEPVVEDDQIGLLAGRHHLFEELELLPHGSAGAAVVAHLDRDAVGLSQAGELRRDGVVVALPVAEERRGAEEPHRDLVAGRGRLVALADTLEDVRVLRGLGAHAVAEERIFHARQRGLLGQYFTRPRTVAQCRLCKRVERVVGHRRGAVRFVAHLVVDPPTTEVGQKDRARRHRSPWPRAGPDGDGVARSRPATRARARRRTDASAARVQCAACQNERSSRRTPARARRTGTPTSRTRPV